MKKVNLILGFFIILFFAYGCKRQNSESILYNYEKIKNSNYKELNVTQQAFFKKELAQTLSEDKDFKELKQMIRLQGDTYLKDNRGKSKEELAKNVDIQNNSLKPSERYKKMGLRKPLLYAKHQIWIVQRMGVLFKKYPEFVKLDRNTKGEILKNALRNK